MNDCRCEQYWDSKSYITCDIHDKSGRKRVEKLTTEELLDEALAYQIHNDFHKLEYYGEGDGWNEPFSESWSCGCTGNWSDAEELEHGWDGEWWVQVDPKCSDRPKTYDIYRSWIKHVRDEEDWYR